MDFTCNTSCSLEQLIGRCFGVDDLGQYGLNWLKNNFLGDILQQRDIYIDTDRKVLKNDFKEQYVSEKELDSYRYDHPYQSKRRIKS